MQNILRDKGPAVGLTATSIVQPPTSNALPSHNNSSSILGNYLLKDNLDSTRDLLPIEAPSRYLSSSGHNTAMTNSRSQQPASSHDLLQQLFNDLRQIEDTVDSIEIPARGRCKVYMAKYGYDPFKQSPNDNPDAELAFNAGDYIMVFDDIDEDGYFIGELMDGRRGYVPSNWLDRLTGEDLFEFQATTLYKQHKQDDESESNSFYPPEFYDAIVSDTMNHSNFQHILAPEDYHRMNDYVDLDDVDEVDDECLSDYERAEAEQMRRAVPPPQRLVLERQLNKSILIGWLHPQAAKGTIVSYQVYVDGVLKSTVPSGDRTKALLEGVDSNIPHRISVRAIDVHGLHSNDAGCTIVIGNKVPFAPSCVKASHITSDSALISWLPCNSNFHHVVAVNSVEVQTVRPGVYKHLINGLSANTLYRVWVRAKPGKILSIDEKNPKKLESLTTYVDFKTMPKSLPDPPVNVQVEAGPQRRTLLVTWLPLTLNDYGSSNGCAVTGYAVFAGHKKLADIDSPTGDHALLDLQDLESLHKKSVTVRTKSGENLSQDSMPCQIPDEYLKPVNGSSHRPEHNPTVGRHRISDPNLHDSSMQTVGQRGHQQRYVHHNNNQIQAGHRGPGHHPPQQAIGGRQYSIVRGRQMARSLQNLESDLDSRRSSIPAIEITRETSGSDAINTTHNESYSEEEFENSMRFRGLSGRTGKMGGRGLGSRYRSRQSHSVDGAVRYGAPGAKARGTPVLDQRDVRFFVALFDYDPSTMSPNPNAASEELGFKEGSIIKVFGDKGLDGFYRGEIDNRIGFVPCNVVSEIRDHNVLYNLHEKHSRQQRMINGASSNNLSSSYLQRSASGQPQQQPPPIQQPQPQQPQHQVVEQQSNVKRMTALYDYDPQENSPNADTESEIPFKVGDVIYVHGKMDTDGFYMGEVERTKQRGLVPSNFLREDPLPANMKPNLQPQSMGFNQTQQQQPMNQIDPLQQQQQQQRPVYQNQFMANGVQQQQNQPGQQQNMSVNSGNLRAGPMMGAMQRAPYDPMNQQQQGVQLQQQPQQQNINRPTSLSLGGAQAGADWTNNQRQQIMGPNQMQQFQLQQPFQGQMMGGYQQQLGQNNMMQPQQANQQQLGGGVLSNLLSSGKQIIGAATTPRAPNQSAQFPPAMNQMGNQVPLDGSNANFAGRGNLMQSGNFINSTDPSSHNSFAPTGNLHGNPTQQQQQQQQHYIQMAGINRGPLNQMGGEEQGGNILNTVKNMFKL